MTDMKMKEMQVRASIHNQLVESGEKERFPFLLSFFLFLSLFPFLVLVCVYLTCLFACCFHLLTCTVICFHLHNLHIIHIHTPTIRLKELLRSKLVECGWRNDVRERCKGLVIVVGLFVVFLVFCLLLGVVIAAMIIIVFFVVFFWLNSFTFSPTKKQKLRNYQ